MKVSKNDIAIGGAFYIYKTTTDLNLNNPIKIPGSDKGIKNGWVIGIVSTGSPPYCFGATALFKIKILETDAASSAAKNIVGFTNRENYLSPDN